MRKWRVYRNHVLSGSVSKEPGTFWTKTGAIQHAAILSAWRENWNVYFTVAKEDKHER